MHTRRNVLRDTLLLPFLVGISPPPGSRIIAGSDCLSQESAEGFRSVLARSHAANLIVLCGAKAVHPRLYDAAVNGAWLIWEMPPAQSTVSHRDLYVHYSWPHPTLTRAFSYTMPVGCADAEAIAHYRGVPVAMKRRMGRGGIIFLGSMLGPNLRAEEPEARELAIAIFSQIACAGTSKAAATNT
jgi:hypothetical protein